MRLGGAACAQVIGLTCESLGPCAYGRPDARSRRAASAGSVADGLELWGSDGSRALLLAVLTLQCAAKPHWWHGGQPAQATTHRANVRVDAGVPWRYVACCGPAAARERRKQARRPPGAFLISTDTTEAGPRRVPPLVVRGGRAASARNSAPEPQLGNNGRGRVSANAQFFHQPLTVSTAWVPRSVSAEWALTRPEDRRAAWKREATFSQFTRFHQALT